jgi:coatomer protein complex subunit epsilon
MTESDELYSLRNIYWLGNFQGAIKEANTLTRCPAHLTTERDEFLYRAYLAQGQYDIIFSEIGDGQDVPLALRALKQLAIYLSDPSSKESSLQMLEGWIQEPNGGNNNTLLLVLAIAYTHDGNLMGAIELLHRGLNIEHSAFLVQLYLKIDRPDLAEKQLKLMKSVDEDCTLSMLCTAWVQLNSEGSKVQGKLI